MPLSIGGSLVAGIAAMLFCLYHRHKWQLTKTAYLNWVRVLLVIAAANLVMTLECFPWDNIQKTLGRFGNIIASIQYPWRWIALATPLLVFGTVLALKVMEKPDKRMYTVFVASILAGLVISTGYFYFRFINEVPVYPSYFKSAYEATDKLYYLKGTNTKMINYAVCEVEEGEAVIESYAKEEGVARLTVKNDTQEEAQIAIPVFAYRGYRAYDGAGQEMTMVTGGNNRVAVRVPAQYDGEIIVRFVSPLYWRIAEAVTLAGLGFMAIMGLKAMRKKQA